MIKYANALGVDGPIAAPRAARNVEGGPRYKIINGNASNIIGGATNQTGVAPVLTWTLQNEVILGKFILTAMHTNSANTQGSLVDTSLSVLLSSGGVLNPGIQPGGLVAGGWTLYNNSYNFHLPDQKAEIDLEGCEIWVPANATLEFYCGAFGTFALNDSVSFFLSIMYKENF